MIYQPDGTDYCGPASVVNALRFYGQRVTLRRVLHLTSADVVGFASPFQIQEGLYELGFRGSEFNTNSEREAKEVIGFGGPSILCVTTESAWDHWVCVQPIPWLRRYLVIDPEPSRSNKADNGSASLTWRALVQRWRAPARAHTDRRGRDRAFYGIRVLRG